jgi:drug/metabolite transporter (DMT)-like permease
MSKQVFDSAPAEIQAAVVEAAKDTVPIQRKIWADYVGEAKAQLKEKVRNSPREKRPPLRESLIIIRDGLLAILAAFVIVGGIAFGIFTVCEASAIAVFYASFVGIFIYKEMHFRDIWRILLDAVRTTTSVLFLIGCASAFAWMMTFLQIPTKATTFLLYFMINILLIGLQNRPFFSQETYGSVAILASVWCFYLETAVVRWATAGNVALSTPLLIFVRFLVGFLVVGCVVGCKRKPLRPCHYSLLLGRAVTNILAVFCSYKAVELTTLAQGSILTMTYPVFIGIFSWFVFKAQRNLVGLFMTVVAFCGILLVISPGEFRLEWNSLWGVISGIIAAVSLMALNAARQHNDTDTVMCVVFGVGTVGVHLVFRKALYVPTRTELFYLLLGAGMAVTGQYLLTMGFRYVSPVKGGVLSSTRIVIAAFFGPYITADPPLNVFGWIGTGLIFGSNLYFIARKSRPILKSDKSES